METIVVGDLNLSIPTDEAIKTLNGEYFRPKKGEVFAVNLRTLIRNAVGSLPSGVDYPRYQKVLHEQVLSDIQTILTLVSEDKGMEVKFYSLNQDNLSRVRGFSKEANWITPNTDKQIALAKIHDVLHRDIMKEFGEVISQDTDYLKSSLGSSLLVLTHIPVDLIDYNAFSSLRLLESHTGTIKDPYRWNSKLKTQSSDKLILPYSSLTLQVFGDGATFKAMNKALRDDVLAVAKKGRWNPSTTKDRIRFCIKEHATMGNRELLNSMLF